MYCTLRYMQLMRERERKHYAALRKFQRDKLVFYKIKQPLKVNIL